MRTTNHRGLHRTPRQHHRRSTFSTTGFRLAVLVPAVAAGAALAAVAGFSGTGSAAPGPAAPTAAAAAAPNPDCTLTVPADPLSAAGLATPYQLTATDPAHGPCHEADAAQSAFVEATVVDPATGALAVYRPLVVDRGTRPAAPEVVPALPSGAVVGIWFGFNGTNLTLHPAGDSLRAGNCTNGAHRSIFGQFAYCNAGRFFAAANAAIGAGRLAVPPLGTARDGLPCPTTRDFGVVDQDQSDNVITGYLARPGGRTAQDTAANAARLRGATTLLNGSDNLLVDHFLDPALGCAPFTAPDLTDPGHRAPSLALNELFAAAHQAAPVALVPTNDPMAQLGGAASAAKTDLYRLGVDQPPLGPADTPAAYCRHLLTLGAQRIQRDRNLTARAPSPDPAAANTLFTFLAQRFAASLTNLGCAGLIDVGNPVTLVTDKAGAVVDATFGGPRR